MPLHKLTGYRPLVGISRAGTRYMFEIVAIESKRGNVASVDGYLRKPDPTFVNDTVVVKTGSAEYVEVMADKAVQRAIRDRAESYLERL